MAEKYVHGPSREEAPLPGHTCYSMYKRLGALIRRLLKDKGLGPDPRTSIFQKAVRYVAEEMQVARCFRWLAWHDEFGSK